MRAGLTLTTTTTGQGADIQRKRSGSQPLKNTRTREYLLACHLCLVPLWPVVMVGPRPQTSHGAQIGCKSWETLSGGCVQLPFTHGRVVQPHWRSGGWARVRASRPREGRRPGPTRPRFRGAASIRAKDRSGADASDGGAGAALG